MNNLIENARKYINTPFHHQGRVKGFGVDCVGLILCACKDTGINLDDVQGYTNVPHHGLLEEQANKQLIKINIEDIQKGDILLFRFLDDPQHVALVTEINDNNIKIIHAYSKVNKVVEHDLDKVWKKRLVSAYRIKG